VSVHILADIRLAQGRLREVERIYTHALALATRNGEALWGTADTLVGLSEIHLERNDLELALQCLHRSKELGDHAGLLDTRHRWYTAMAGIMQAEGDLDGALAMLDEAERLYVRGADPDLRPISAQKARVWMSQGRLADATRWAAGQDLLIDEGASYLREFDQLMVVRVRIAEARKARDTGTVDDAISLLGHLLETAERGERWDSVIRIRIVQALGYEATNDVPAALMSLGPALSLAEPEGYVRVFIGEGEPMERLLAEASEQGIAPSYVSLLRNAMLATGDQ
jgi:LuxR family maltose regulon positive regulatory protein